MSQTVNRISLALFWCGLWTLEVSDIRTRFLDVPIVNISSAENLFSAIKTSLNKYGIDFSKAVSFMSDTTNVMKGSRSGVQKRIKDENPQLYDVACIFHLADLTVKAGMETLPVDIDQLFIDIFIIFTIPVSASKNLEICGALYSLQSQK